jgi:hypothetical protein
MREAPLIAGFSHGLREGVAEAGMPSWRRSADRARLHAISLLSGKLTGNFAILGPQKPISLHETTVLQRLSTKFPTQINRENILKIREFSSGNREFHC